MPRDEVEESLDLRAPEERLAPELDVFARVLPVFFAPLPDAPEPELLDDLAPLDLEAPLLALLERAALDLLAVDDALRPPLDRPELLREDDDPEPA